MKKTAVYPGSFDPLTFGHLEMVQRICEIFDQVIILVSRNTTKNELFNIEERVELIEKVLSEEKLSKKVKVELHEGLTSDYFKKKENVVCIRGLRTAQDFEGEFSLSSMNKQLYSQMETLFLISSPEYAHVSSSLVKEIAKFKGDLSKFVPSLVAKKLKERIK